MGRTLLSVAVALAACGTLAGCGVYSTSGGFPTGIETMGAEFFENETTEPALAERLNRVLTDRLVGRPQFRYGSARAADAVIRGTILRVRETPLSFTGQQAERYEVLVTARAEVWDRTRRRSIWSNDAVRGVGTYEQAGGPTARDRALDEALNDVATRIIDGVLSGW